MLAAVSPYHLTTREPPAMTGLLLAERVVTFLPGPAGGAPAARAAARASERFRNFIESWRWSASLWQHGVLVPELEGDDATSDVRSACVEVETDPRLACLRAFIERGVFEDERRFLDRVAVDLLKGGPDPATSVPVAAGIDRFAARHGVFVLRAAPISMAQRAEARLATPIFAFAIPILTQAQGESLLTARDMLALPLDELRAAIDALANGLEGGRAPTRERVEAIAAAAARYAQRFGELREDLIALADTDEERVMDGLVTVSGVMLPPDAVLRSSATAMRAVTSTPRVESTTTALVRADHPRSVLSLVVKSVG